MGRPRDGGCSRVRRAAPDTGVRRTAMGLQQRLPVRPGDVAGRGPAGLQPRVHQPRADVPRRLPRPGDDEAGPDREPWDVGRRGTATRRRDRSVEAGARPTGATQPPDHRLDADPGGGPGRWRPSPADHRRPGRRHRPGDAQQLCRRDHSLGHGAQRRRELQPVLRQVGNARQPVRRVVRPLRRHRHRQPGLERGRPSLRPVGGAARAVPVRLDHRGRSVRPGLHAAQAHHARSPEARGREPRHHARRARRGVHGRRPGQRVHLQVRLPGHRPARPGPPGP